MRNNKLAQVALRIVALLAQESGLRQTEIARKLGEHDSTIMRALPYTEELELRLAEDDEGRLSLAEQAKF
jgi:DNA-binding IclR family transcriptional regulator